jgi:4-hydroxyphenylpyruvate dioxygenase
MPDRVDVNGVAFVEFSADETDALTLGVLLTTLGFVRIAEHRSKHVMLYRQGDIRIIINTERSGYAHTAYKAHGTSAYAVALTVDDANAALARAVALGAEQFGEPVAQGELEIPAIRGIGGSLIYLVDDTSNLGRFQQIDFDPIGMDFEELPRPAGLERIDHLAQTVPYEQMPSWLLFYTSIFATEKTPVVDIVDPSGVVRSQVIANTSGALRITMNGAENNATLAGHFLAEKFGSAVQHIAFASSDIFASAAALEANGFRSLQISPNYYDDVEARFGLDPDFTDRLRTHNILYDRDDHGEYLQLYSTTFGEGFFFEIVERRGYQGYGAANAIFRIAALKKDIRRSDQPAA